MSIVTRFPPSPTGFMHIGNARTALFNWLYAKHTGGKFVVRIEDTDRKRHSEDAVQAIIDGLQWLGLDHDGEITSQFANQARHREIALELLEKGKAYQCYCSPEELQEMRDQARAEGKQTSYDRRWRDSDQPAPEGVEPVIRIKAPLDGATTIHDKVQGEVTVQNENLDDFIILRSDGSPTYMLSVVVDDHDMGITHIMRGDDHLNNTFRQKIVFDAMGWDVPEFAHLPLIHGPDGAKFSKRHGAQSLEEYREMGYLPEAMRNYLMRLGWGHGDDEIIPTDKAIEWFDFDGIGKAAAKFDFAKLESLNAHYIDIADNNDLMAWTLPFFKSRHGVEPDQEAQKRIIAHMDELKSRAKTLLQITDEALFYTKNVPFDFDEKASNMLDADATQVLDTLDQEFTKVEWNDESIQTACKSVADTLRDGKLGKVAMPLRAALTGTTVSPSIFKAAEILGLDETRARIQNALNFIKNKA
ncbi:MAG: glutamate--tRNA ligase [Alphaproteobacteria bacterium]|nr:glutamate--tRNA ligase [Alphaproteobacteria bacterium]